MYKCPHVVCMRVCLHTQVAHEDIDCAGEDSSNGERDAAAVSVPAAVPVRSTEDDECASASEVGNARTFGGGRAGGWW